LSSEDLIPSTPTINEPEEYDVEFSIDEEFIKNFTKAHSALDKPNYFTVESKVEDSEKFIELCVGNSDSYANKIKLRQNATFTFGVEKLPFSANVFKEILSVNKNAVGKVQINENGLLKLVFTEDTTTSTYFLVKLSE
jgi:molecular chaperone DnaK (HSP70)